jgi:hypothetical protein
LRTLTRYSDDGGKCSLTFFSKVSISESQDKRYGSLNSYMPKNAPNTEGVVINVPVRKIHTLEQLIGKFKKF